MFAIAAALAAVVITMFAAVGAVTVMAWADQWMTHLANETAIPGAR